MPFFQGHSLLCSMRKFRFSLSPRDPVLGLPEPWQNKSVIQKLEANVRAWMGGGGQSLGRFRETMVPGFFLLPWFFISSTPFLYKRVPVWTTNCMAVLFRGCP